jgi:DNA-binding NarL/FixJ family response regulator
MRINNLENGLINTYFHCLRPVLHNSSTTDTMSIYRIIQADDHALVREGIKKILLEDPDLCVIGETGDGQELLRLVEEKTPDMVLLDISMPGLRGLEAIKLIKQSHPQVRILVLTIHKTKNMFI